MKQLPEIPSIFSELVYSQKRIARHWLFITPKRCAGYEPVQSIFKIGPH
jgi:hypothetical protein